MLDRENVNEGLQVHDDGGRHGSGRVQGHRAARCARRCRRPSARARAAPRARRTTTSSPTASSPTAGPPATSRTCRSACTRKACSSCASSRTRPIPERFYYDNMTLVRHVDDPKYSVPGWMGLPKGTDVTGATRPNIEHYRGGRARRPRRRARTRTSTCVEAVQRGQKSRGFRGPAVEPAGAARPPLPPRDRPLHQRREVTSRRRPRNSLA